MLPHDDQSRTSFRRFTSRINIGRIISFEDCMSSQKWLYSLTGLSVLKLSADEYYPKFEVICFYLLYTMILVFMYYERLLNMSFSSSINAIQKKNMILISFIGLTILEMFMILIVTCIQSEKFLSLTKTIKLSEKRLLKLQINSDYKWLLQKISLNDITTLMTVGLFLTIIFRIYVHELNNEYIMEGIVFVIPVLVLSLFYDHYMTIMSLYNKRFNQLDGLLKQLLINPNVPHHVNIRKLLFPHLDDSEIFTVDRRINDNFLLIQKIRLSHLEFVNLAKMTDALYGIPIIITLLITFVTCSNILCILYLSIMNKGSFIYIIISIFLLIFFVSKLIVIAISCGRTSKSADKIGYNVNKLRDSSVTSEFNSELEKFLYQLVNNKLVFMPCGLFELNTNILTTVATVIVSLLAIFIDFDGLLKATGEYLNRC